jgi:hypothetical protein
MKNRRVEGLVSKSRLEMEVIGWLDSPAAVAPLNCLIGS